jgi:hypothetical protein
MKSIFGFIFILFSVLAVSAQMFQPSPTPTRQRVVNGSTPTLSPTPFKSPTPSPTPTPVTNNPNKVVVTNTLPLPAPVVRPSVTPTATPIINPIPSDHPTSPNPMPVASPAAYKILTLAQLRSKIAEAKRLLQTRPMPTAWTDSFPVTDMVRMAFYDWKQSQIDFIVMSKTSFLARDTEIPIVVSSNGKYFSVRIIRANGVNTAITISDPATGQPSQPLVVQYPIEKSGSLREMAYYSSAHPGIVTPEIIGAGKLYVHNTIDIAREKLQQKGIYITPQVADIAERLSTVEHVDHQRFWSEYQPNLFNEIFALYALNEGNTYRFSVSSAGAGGMVQMIPATYFMIRNRYYNVGLIPDFVEGMRNHVNAAQAMLLYMQMTWSDMASNDTIYTALANGTATQAELMAAGYNSNPAKLPGYIRRGGSNWRTLIPRETKIYLQIYSSLESAIPMAPRTK